jgi:hypothetical protein
MFGEKESCGPTAMLASRPSIADANELLRYLLIEFLLTNQF